MIVALKLALDSFLAMLCNSKRTIHYKKWKQEKERLEVVFIHSLQSLAIR